MTAPHDSEAYGRPMPRRTRAGTTPLDPDWLVTRRLERDLRRALARYARGTVLDVGCGGRPYESLLPQGARMFGLDTPASVEAHPDALALATALPIASASVDTVLCTQVIEHLAEPSACLREIARVLRPGGHALISAPQAANLHEEPFDFFRYTAFGLRHLCVKAGLEPVEVHPQGGFWATIGFFSIIHVGSYARWAAERGGTRARSRWRADLWPLRLPMAAVSLAFACLDALPEPGLFAANHLVVARRPEVS